MTGKFPARRASNAENVPYDYLIMDYCQFSNISRTLVGNKIVDHSDVVGAAPELYINSNYVVPRHMHMSTDDGEDNSFKHIDNNTAELSIYTLTQVNLG